MKNLNDTERRFAEILSDVSFDIDTNELWASVEDKLPAERKKLRFPLWIFGGLTGVMLIVGLFWNPLGDNIGSKSEASVSISSPAESSVFDGSAALEETIEKVAAERETVLDVRHSSSNLTSEESIVAVDQQIVPKTTIDSEDTRKSAPSDTTYEFQADQEIFKEIVFSQLPPPSGSKSSTTASKEIKKSSLLSVFHPLTQTESEMLKIEERHMDIGVQKFFTLPIVVSTSSSKWSPYYSLTLGSIMNRPSYTPGIIDAQTLESFSDKERSLPGIVASIQAGIENSKGWNLFAGLRQSQLVNQYRNFGPTSNSVLLPGTESLSVNEQGVSTPVSGTITSTTVKLYAQNLFRKQNVLDIYLGGGKRFSLNENWAVATQASVSYNILSTATGYYFTEEFPVVAQLSDNADSEYKQRIGMGGRFGLSLERKLSASTAISLSPFMSSYINSLDIENNFSIKNSQFGLSVGITYRPYREQN